MDFAPPPGAPTPNVLLYGPAKTGKTAGACSAPGRAWLFNCDLGAATRYARRREGERVKEIALPPYEEGKVNLLRKMMEIQDAVMQAEPDVDVVVVDPLSELYRRLLDEVSNRTMKPTFDHRLAVTVYMERFARMLCDAPVAAVFVCHELIIENKATESYDTLPNTGTSNPNLGSKLLGMVDIIGYTGMVRHEDGSKEWGAQLIIEKGRRGGDRFDCLGDYQPLNLAHWWKLIEEAENTSVSTLTSAPEAKAA